MKLFITPAYRTSHNKNYDTSDWVNNINSLNLRQVHESDVTAIHHIGARGLCTIIKNRYGADQCKIYLDQIPSYLVNLVKLPRKRKKQLKNQFIKTINQYKSNL